METKEEAALLLSYAMSGSGEHWKAGAMEQQRYVDALKIQLPTAHRLDSLVFKHPILLGGLDIVSRLLYPRCILQSKLIIATALVECHTASAPWLLPRERGLGRWVFAVLGVSLKLAGKLCVGITLLLFPGFVRRNVGAL